MTVEFTMKIGCPVACLNYCPQEIITKNYAGVSMMQFDAFRFFMKTIPTSQTIIFSGLSEPFANPECIDMMEWTHNQGYPIWLFTTLVGVTREISERLIQIPVDRLCLHLPDSTYNARIPITSEYKDVLGNVLGFMPNLEFMNMGGLFSSNRTEEFVRGKPFPRKNWNIWCRFLESPQYNVLPNGDVYTCCVTQRFVSQENCASGIIGNLYESAYPELEAKFPQIKQELVSDKNSICHTCPASEVWWKHAALNFRME